MKVTVGLLDGGPVVIWHWPDDRAAAVLYRDRWWPGSRLAVVSASALLKPGQLLVTNAPEG